MKRIWILAFVVLCHLSAGAAPGQLQALMEKGEIAVNLTGDGSNTSEARLTVTNRTPRSLNIAVPAGQVFVPEDPAENQFMMTREATEVSVPPGETVTVESLPTACISPKSVPPPGPNSVYSPGDYPDPFLKEVFENAIEISQEKDRSGDYDGLAIPPERRAQTISQLSIWMIHADITDKPEDQVNEETIAADFLNRAGIERESLTPEQQESFDQEVSSIFGAVDLTCKQAQDSTVYEIGDTSGSTRTKTPDPVITKGPHGEEIITEFHPDGTVARRTTRHRPTPGGDPRDPTSETHVTEVAEYAKGEKIPHTRTTITEVRTLWGIDGQKRPKKTTTRSKRRARDKKGRRYTAEETLIEETLVEIQDNGLPRMRRVTTTKTRTGPKDRTGKTTTKQEVFDYQKKKWVPEK